VDRVSVVVVVENHKNNALFLGSSISSILSSMPQTSGTHLLVETQKNGFGLRPLTERLTPRALLSRIPPQATIARPLVPLDPIGRGPGSSGAIFPSPPNPCPVGMEPMPVTCSPTPIDGPSYPTQWGLKYAQWAAAPKSEVFLSISSQTRSLSYRVLFSHCCPFVLLSLLAPTIRPAAA